MRPFERPNATQFSALRAWLIGKGFAPGLLNEAVGTAPQGRALATIGDSLRARLKTLPKAQGTGVRR